MKNNLVPQGILPVSLSNLRKYNKDWKLPEIVMFTKIILNSRTYSGYMPIYKASLEKELRVSRKVVNRLIKYFEDILFIKKVSKKISYKGKTLYKVNTWNIVNSAELIFNLGNPNENPDNYAALKSSYTMFLRGFLKLPESEKILINMQE